MKDYAKKLEDKLNKSETEIHELQALTVKIPVSDLSMVDSICDRFGEKRIHVLRKIISSGVMDLFQSFEVSTRLNLAADADSKTTKTMIDRGCSCSSSTGFGNFENEWVNWRMCEYSIQLHEKTNEILSSEPDLDDSEDYDDVFALAAGELKIEFSLSEDE